MLFGQRDIGDEQRHHALPFTIGRVAETRAN
jgi:hypothetical protein